MNPVVPEPLSTVLTLLVGLAGGMLARHYRLPGGAILWAMAAVVAVRLPFEGFVELDPRFRVLGQILIGTAIGSVLTRSPLRALRPLALPVAVSMVVLLAVSVACGIAFAALTDLPLLTALFSTSPGGATDMSAAALQLDADAALVAGFHLVRQVLIFVVLATAFSRIFGTGGPPPARLDDT